VPRKKQLRLFEAKLERADQHIRDLEVLILPFKDKGRYDVYPKTDLKTRNRHFYVGRVDPIPPEICCVAGDAIHVLRSVLDHLAWQLVCSNGNTPSDQTCFPISKSSAIYKTESPRKVKGMRQEAIELIDGIKPYKGGSEWLWWLHKLDIVDKHRILMTVASSLRGHSASPLVKEQFSRGFVEATGRYPTGKLANVYTAVRPVPITEAGDEILVIPESDVSQDMDFVFDVALNEVAIVETRPILEFIQEFARRVRNIFPHLGSTCDKYL
jgi:hypothetical protein